VLRESDVSGTDTDLRTWFKLGYKDSGHPEESCHPTKSNRFTNYRDFSPQHLFTMDPREVAIELAIQDYHAGVYKSERALQDRLKGATNRATSHQHQQRLSPEQEEFLVQWILEEDARACPPSRDRAREIAILILRMNGDQNPLSKKWLLQFIQRNPRVASVVSKEINA
jgi:hypothetical protein